MKYPIERGLSKMDEEQILDGLKPICLCKGIRKSVFLKHIAAGR
jgi:hypothetical protein